MKNAWASALWILCAAALASSARAENLLPDPSFEHTKPKDRFGNCFAEWTGSVQEGGSRFEASSIAHGGKTSIEIVGSGGGKIKFYSKEIVLPAGRYRFSIFVRGLDIGVGRWHQNLIIGVGGEKLMGVKKNGTFGWSPMTYVFDAPDNYKFKLTFGEFEEGYVWADDACLEKVANDVELTPLPVFGAEEKPVVMPGPLPAHPVRCPECGYRNDPAWGNCYACGTKLEAAAAQAFTSPAVKVIADFEDGKPAPFKLGQVVQEHATSGKFALKCDKGILVIPTMQDWSEHDYLSFDVFNAQDKPVKIFLDIRDPASAGYWGRVNVYNVVMPGANTVTIPTDLNTGERNRPGRPLDRSKVSQFAFSAEDGPLYLDNFRLVRIDTSKVFFPELSAYQFRPADGAKMRGFEQAGRAPYSAGRGFGWTKANWWRDFNCLFPDSLYQGFVCPNSGTFRVDLPNGKYHVWMNIDAPGGHWGEIQCFADRKVTANGNLVVDEHGDFDSFAKIYWRNASREDLPGIDTFKEYISTMFHEKTFDVDVTDGKLELDFKGSGGFAFSLSAMVIYPDAKKAEGESFLKWVADRRRFEFENDFKQVAPTASGAAKPASGCRVFRTEALYPVNACDGPKEGEELKPDSTLALTVAKGEESALAFAVQPAGDIGTIGVEVSDPVNAAGHKLGAAAIRPGWFDYRITRLQLDGAFYDVSPRYWHPTPAPAAAGITRNFFIRVKTAPDAEPGDYKGVIRVRPAKAAEFPVPFTITVRPFALDPITDVSVSPTGVRIGCGWNLPDKRIADWNETMFAKSLDAIRETGCSGVTGCPDFKATADGGKITLDTTEADREMALLREKGFTQLVYEYGAAVTVKLGPAGRYRLYDVPSDAEATAAGFKSGQDFLNAFWKAVDDHAVEANWLPVSYALCDEPMGPRLDTAIKIAKMDREAAKGLKRTTFSGATSMLGDDPKNDHYELLRALPSPTLGNHDEASIAVLKEAGNRLSFYNCANPWTMGRYMKFLVVKHGLLFRSVWHYNACAGDPYFALDCKEDDFCWFNSNEKGELIPSKMVLCKVMPGLNDYRYLSTLERLIKEKPNHPAAADAKKVFDEMMDLKAGKADRDRGGSDLWDMPDEKHRPDYAGDRAKVSRAIETLLQ